jgi:hypothetical protein
MPRCTLPREAEEQKAKRKKGTLSIYVCPTRPAHFTLHSTRLDLIDDI